MGLFNFNKKVTTVENGPLISTFSTPFGKIGEGNLSTPWVKAYGSESYVRFGYDNLYPQLINQIYYVSPLNGSIINFKTNAVIGGGFELTSPADRDAKQKVAEYTFMKKNKFNKLMKQATKDLIMHGRICVIIYPGDDTKIERIGPEKVRNNKDKTLYTISDDWSTQTGMWTLPRWKPGCTTKSMYVYEIDGDAGQDIYPIPQYCSALNWAFVDAESSYLHKSNIINSIFPSFMIKLAKKFSNQEEINQFKDTINKAKGAPAAGRIMTFVANDPSQLPEIVPIPTNGNDTLFTQTDERIDANISRAHSIDPIIMGIRVSGKLGSGNDIKESYKIFEKNVVMPLREEMTEFADDLLSIANINSNIKINNFQIIGDEIINKTQ